MSNESKWSKDKNGLVASQRDHPWLQTFGLFFGNMDPSNLRAEIPVLNVRRFCLKSNCFINSEEKFSDWVVTNRILEELNIEVDDFDTNEGADFRKFAQAVGVNQSLRTLSVGGDSLMVFETLDEKSPYEQCLVDLVEGISRNTSLAKLVLEFDFNNFLESNHSSKWQVVKYLELLEAVNPGLILEKADPCLKDSIRNRIFGAGVTANSAPIEIPANEFTARFGWLSAEQMPGPEESVLFRVEMPTWGKGAFRKMVSQWSMRDKDKKKLILEGLSDGSLAKESIQVLRIVPTEDSQEETLSDSYEDR